MKEGVTYKVRAFVETENYLVYGEEVSFFSLGSKVHEITNYHPTTISYGDTLTIEGKRFSGNTENYDIKIGSFKANVLNASDTIIKVKVPLEKLDLESTLSVSIFGNNVLGSEALKLKPMSFENIEPKSAKSYDTLKLTGHFGYLPDHTEVNFGDHQSELISLSDSLILSVVPPGIEEGDQIEVKVGLQSNISSDFLYLKPKVIDFPDSITWSKPVSILGQNLQTDACCNNVYFRNGSPSNNLVPCEVLQRSDSSITFLIPKGFTGFTNAAMEFQDAGHEMNFRLYLKKPIVQEIIPKTITYGSEVNIMGENFHPAENYIHIIGDNTMTVDPSSNDANQITFNFPVDAKSDDGKFTLRVYPGLISNYAPYYDFQDVLIVNKLDLFDFQSKEINNREENIVITGKGFNPSITNNQVYFNSTELSIVSITESELQVSLSNILSDPMVSKSLKGKLSVISGGQTDFFEDSLVIDYVAHWEKISTLPESRGVYQGRSVLLNDIIYLIAGSKTESSSDPEFVTQVYEFDIQTLSWSNFTSLPDAGRLAPFVQSGFDQFYYGLGTDININYDDIYSFSPMDDSWKSIASIPTRIYTERGGQFYPPASYFDGNLHVLVGDSTYVYDTGLNAWSKEDHVGYESEYDNGSIFGAYGFLIDNQPHLLILDRNNSDFRDHHSVIYKKEGGVWDHKSTLESWSIFHTVFNGVLYMAYNGSIYKLNIPDYTLTPLDVPENLLSSDIVLLCSSESAIYVGLSDNTLWKYVP
ncbi:MAG: IPT/TIG domain-containing protein [Cyclobacteriaceae bacterium]